MRDPLWKRIYRRRVPITDSSPTEDVISGSASPTIAEREVLRRLRDRYSNSQAGASKTSRFTEDEDQVIDLREQLADLGMDPARAKAYQEWAERMRRKKEERKKGQQDQPRRGYDPHWDPRHLFEDRSPASRTDATRAQLLAVLELPPTADEASIQRQYKKLVKLHHPDRYATAPTDVRLQHEEQIRRITAAYQALQTPVFRKSRQGT